MIRAVARPGDGVHPEPLPPQLMTPPPLREEIAVPGSPEATLLNDPQRRHLGITLGQVRRRLHRIAARPPAPAPRDGWETGPDALPAEFGRRAPEAIAGLDR